MKITIFRESDGACDLYRATLPLQTAAAKQEIELNTLWTANLFYDALNQTETFKKGMSADIFLLQRIAGQSLVRKIKEFISEADLPTKIVLDYDDNVFAVSPLSNHYVDYGTEELKIVHEGKVIHEWKDGENFNLKGNRERIDQVKRTLELVDLVTVTTDSLAEVYRQYNDNIRVLPNCVDMSQWNRLDINRKDQKEVRIAWAGGHSHFEDLLTIREPLIEIAKKYPNVKIVMVGYMPKSMEKQFRKEQFEFHGWVDTAAHPYRMASLDIDLALVPIKKTPFNMCKSAIKWIEFASLKIPCVTSYLPPYKETADIDEENGIYIEENDKDGWLKAMELLVNSPELRSAMGSRARKTAEENFDINKRYHEWLTAYGEVLSVNSSKSLTV